MLGLTGQRPKNLYLHVPFCPHVCPYCDFHKMLRDERLVARYIERMRDEILELGRRWGGPLETVYLGGGTPSHLTDAELATLFGSVDTAFGGVPTLEVTLEADPGTFDASRLDVFRSWGVTRLSLGVQSLQEDTLRFLGRAHSAQEARYAAHAALEAGFEVSVDLMTAVPGQDTEADLRALAELGARHLSVYTLSIEPYTPFALRNVSVNEDHATDAYLQAAEVLSAYGYERYEVSNHAQPGAEAVHNQAYWHGAPFLAAGPSAAAYLPSDRGLGVRVTNPPIKAWLEGAPAEREDVDAERYLLERLMTGLRTRRGVDLEDVTKRCGVDPRERFKDLIADLVGSGHLILDDPDTTKIPATGSTLRATPDGLLVLDAILRRFAAA